MKQQARSKRSRTKVLDAALALFSTRGYRATNVRAIARQAGVATGNVYHQFADKEAIFQALLRDFFGRAADPGFPFQKALASGAFPNDLIALGHAAREVIQNYRPYVSLIYVDVVEFEGSHIRRFYQDAGARAQTFIESDAARDIQTRIRPGVSPRTAIMFATRFLYQYFILEVVFGVPDYFGHDADKAIGEIADILAYGILMKSAASS